MPIYTPGKVVLAKDYIPVDPDFNSVSLLLHGNGTNGSTTITDNSPTPNTVTAVGNAQTSTAQSKFGESSIAFDGAGDHLSIPYSTSIADWYSTAYTLEAFINASSYSSWGYLIAGLEVPSMVGNASKTGTINYWSFGPDRNSKLAFHYYNGSSAVQVRSTSSVPVNEWVHVAFTQSSSQVRLFVNGALVANASIVTPQIDSAIGFSIGQINNASISGYIDEFRITKSVARYTSNFTPPTAPFPDIASR